MWTFICATDDGTATASEIKMYVNGTEDSDNQETDAGYVATEDLTAEMIVP